MSQKTLVVAERPMRLFVSGVALATVDLARTLGPTAQPVFLHHLDQCLQAAIQDREGRYTETDRRALRALLELLHDEVRRIPSLEH